MKTIEMRVLIWKFKTFLKVVLTFAYLAIFRD